MLLAISITIFYQLLCMDCFTGSPCSYIIKTKQSDEKHTKMHFDIMQMQTVTIHTNHSAGFTVFFFLFQFASLTN